MKQRKARQLRRVRSPASKPKTSTKDRKSKQQSKARNFTRDRPKRTGRFPFDEAIDLAKKARPLLDLTRPVIFHGTRHPRSILRLDALLSATRRAPRAEVPPIAISCTRSIHIALYWAMLKRIGGDENQGVVFVLDRTRLAQDFRLRTYRDSFWDHDPERRNGNARNVKSGSVVM